MARFIRNPRRLSCNAHASDIYNMLGTSKLPAEGMPERLIDGIRVYVKPLPQADARGNRQSLRVTAICECGRHVAVGRLHQHICRVPEPMRLVDKTTGKPVAIGDTVTSFRGETATVVGSQLPKHPGSTGRVYVKWAGQEFTGAYYPSVFNLR